MQPVIRSASLANASAISELVCRVAAATIFANGPEDGRRYFMAMNTPAAVAGKMNDDAYRYYVAEEGRRMVGMIALRGNAHLYHLFIDDAMHRSGLGRRLWDHARSEAAPNGNRGRFTVNATPDTTGLYERLGFKVSGEMHPGPPARITPLPQGDGEHRDRGEGDVRSGLPFKGMLEADFSWVAAVPWITQWLAEYGAEVIKVESNTRPDATRVTGPFKDQKRGLDRCAQFLIFNRSKRGITLNLNHPRGREVARQLVAKADVVTESFSPGMMKRWGLDYEALARVNPGMIMLSSSMLGATSPHSAQPGVGLQLTRLTISRSTVSGDAPG